MSLMDRTQKLQGKGVPTEEAAKYLVAGETIVDLVHQLTPHKTKTLVLTSERLLIFTKELLKTTFIDFYFKDINDIHYQSDVIKQASLTIQTERNAQLETIEVRFLPIETARTFYLKMQQIEKEWTERKREMDLEEKRAASGASHYVMGTPAPANTQAPAEDDIEARLAKLKSLKDKGLIDDATYQQKYSELISRL